MELGDIIVLELKGAMQPERYGSREKESNS